MPACPGRKRPGEAWRCRRRSDNRIFRGAIPHRGHLNFSIPIDSFQNRPQHHHQRDAHVLHRDTGKKCQSARWDCVASECAEQLFPFASTEFRAPTARPISASKGRTIIYGSAKAAPQRSDASIRAARHSRNSRCRPQAPRRSASTSGMTAICGSRKRKPTRSAASRPSGTLNEFDVPTANAGPDAMGVGPDGNIWFSETDAGSDRPHHAGRNDHRIQNRHIPRQQAAVDRGARRRALVQRGRRQPGRPHHHRRRK